MTVPDHRHRVAAVRRDKMRYRLLASAMQLAASKDPALTSIDEITSTAGVSRGTFYKYFASPEALLKELAVQVANELILLAEPVVLERSDPAERVACGIQLVSRLAIQHPLAASFLARMGGLDARGPSVVLDFLRRDLTEGIEQGRFRPVPMALAVNIVSGAVLGATQRMLEPDCEPDFAEMTAAAALRALGMDAPSADLIAARPVSVVQIHDSGVLAQTLAFSTMHGAGTGSLMDQ